MNSIMNGPGSERFAELSAGHRRNGRTFNSGVKRESRTASLGLSKTVHHTDLVEGDLVSINATGKIVPLDPVLKFGGIIEGVGEGGQGYHASLITRCALSTRVAGLNGASREGEQVYAVPGLNTQGFTVDADGGVLVGEILAFEDRAQSRAIVGIRLAGDDRPFALMSPRPR